MTDDELRDSFGDEITDALRVRARGATEPPPVQQDLRLARSRRHTVAAAVVAFAVGAAAAVGVAVLVARDDQARVRVGNAPQATTTTASSGSSPLASGIESWTWVNDDHGWALLRRPCGANVCSLLRETTNGGRTWSTRPVPGANVSGVRFATPEIGWLFGPALFETRDGGHTWTRQNSDRVIDVEAAHGVAMRMTTADRDCGAGCAQYLDRLNAGARGWQRLPGRPIYQFPLLLLQGPDTYVASIPNFAGAGEADLRVSRDAGATWKEIGDPCTSGERGYRTASASAAPGGVIVVLCLSVDEQRGTIRVSTDRGETFGPRHEVPDVPLNALFSPVAAGSAQTIAVAYTDQREYGVVITDDGGATWHTTLQPSEPPTRASAYPPTLGWQDAKTARVSFNTDAIWTTRDSGRSWTRHLVSP
jgi:photosystem II stability/assembly factor-like uncharacterized protein